MNIDKSGISFYRSCRSPTPRRMPPSPVRIKRWWEPDDPSIRDLIAKFSDGQPERQATNLRARISRAKRRTWIAVKRLAAILIPLYEKWALKLRLALLDALYGRHISHFQCRLHKDPDKDANR